MTASCREARDDSTLPPAAVPYPMSDAFHGRPARTAVVVAHPDDECLWLSALLAASDRIVFCFGAPFERPRMAAARRQAVAALPLPRLTDLQIPESGAGFSVDWAKAQPTSAGIEITEPGPRARYEANHSRLLEQLRPVLTGYSDVCTHNPWGEYGHTEHIQVYRAVAALQAELGYTIWFSNYVAAANWSFARRLGRQPCWARRLTVEPDRDTARGLMRIYQRHGAWTWTRFHRWPAHETLYAQPPAGSPEPWSSLAGEWLLDIAGLRWWPPPWRAARRYLD